MLGSIIYLQYRRMAQKYLDVLLYIVELLPYNRLVIPQIRFAS